MAEAQLLTKEQVLERLSKHDVTKTVNVDFVSKNNKIVFDELPVFKIGKRDYPISSTGIATLVDMVGLPNGLPKKLADYPDLLVHNLNYMVDRKNLQCKVLLRGNNVVSFVPSGKVIIPHEKVIANLDKRIKDIRFDKLFDLPEGVANIHCFTGNGQKLEVGKGDYFKTGVKVVNSALGMVMPSVNTYAVRLACLNGAIANDIIWSAKNNLSVEDAPEWLDDAIVKANKVGKSFFEKIRNLQDVKVDKKHIDDFLVSIYGDLGIPISVRDLITRRIAQEGADNMYDVFNHITYVGSNYAALQENPRFMNRLLTASGALTNHASVCPTCHRFA